jgi:hypothetical protein
LNKWDFHAKGCGRGDKRNALPKKFSYSTATAHAEYVHLPGTLGSSKVKNQK